MESYARPFCLVNVAHWVHRCPHPSRHLLPKLLVFAGFYYQLRVGFVLLFGWRGAEIFLRDHPYLHHRQCIVSSFNPLVVWGSVSHLP